MPNQPWMFGPPAGGGAGRGFLLKRQCGCKEMTGGRTVREAL